ncbi:MAG: hypothetical protein NTZ68_02760 [Candidatus Dependentiae bacterium]|nr:hypothetical protein [Candidatus Dependentiae bacterium]
MGYKKLLTAFLLIFAATLESRDILLEAKAAYFFSTNKLFRDIYGAGSGLYGGEITAELGHDIYIWGNGSFFTKKGRSIGECNPTKVTLIPLSAGLKYMHSLRRSDLYLGLGALATHLTTCDDSPYVCRKQSKWGFGGIVKSGVFIHVARSFYFDIFADYSFIKVHFSKCCDKQVQSHSAPLDGMSLGIGLTYRFD